jgi:hypothetical protein
MEYEHSAYQCPILFKVTHTIHGVVTYPLSASEEKLLIICISDFVYFILCIKCI